MNRWNRQARGGEITPREPDPDTVWIQLSEGGETCGHVCACTSDMDCHHYACGCGDDGSGKSKHP